MLSIGGLGCPLMRESSEVEFGINGLYEYQLFDQNLWITTTHVCLIIVLITLVLFAFIANRAIKKADSQKVPTTFLNIVEFLVETVDKMTQTNMGEFKGKGLANYIGTLFGFIFLSNISGLFGLRPPTADYGITLSLGIITFLLIHYYGFKYQKFRHITGLFKPLLLTPINIIGEIAIPISLSLRLFGNVLSGTVMLSLIYALLPKILLLIWPAALHVYFDLFSGAIQTYVFCMLTMVFIAQTFQVEDAL